MTETVYTVKLRNGEEFIATKSLITPKSDPEKIYEFEKPMVLVNTGQGFQLIPWITTIKATGVTLPQSEILVISETNDELAEGYIDATTESLIETPEHAGLVLPN